MSKSLKSQLQLSITLRYVDSHINNAAVVLTTKFFFVTEFCGELFNMSFHVSVSSVSQNFSK
jgi:hypothetical protein